MDRYARPAAPVLLLLAPLVLGAGCDDPATSTAGTWRLAAPLNVPRTDHTATLLADGRVLVAGGWQSWNADGSSAAIASVELYDPVTGTWRETAPMNLARHSHGAALLDDGRVLVAGGSSRAAVETHFGVTATWGWLEVRAELFDPASESWSETGALPHPWAIFNVTDRASLRRLSDGRILAAGAWSDLSDDTTGGLSEAYDPDTGAWSPLGVLPDVCHGPLVRRSAGHLALLGRCGHLGLGPTQLFDLDEASATWSVSTPPGGGRHGFTLTPLEDGRLLAVGGCRDDWYWPCSSPVPLAGALFDPATASWSPTSDMHFPRYYGTALRLPSGRVLVMTGNASAGVTAENLGFAPELYDPATDTWTITPAMPHFVNINGVPVLLPSGEVIFTGGTLYDGIELSNPHTWGIASTMIYRE